MQDRLHRAAYYAILSVSRLQCKAHSKATDSAYRVTRAPASAGFPHETDNDILTAGSSHARLVEQGVCQRTADGKHEYSLGRPGPLQLIDGVLTLIYENRRVTTEQLTRNSDP